MIPVFITLENTGASFPENPILPPVPPTYTHNQTNKTFFRPIKKKKKMCFVFRRDGLKTEQVGGFGKMCSVVLNH